MPKTKEQIIEELRKEFTTIFSRYAISFEVDGRYSEKPYVEAALEKVKAKLPELAREAGYVKLADMSRRDFLKLPLEERRKILSQQVAEMFENIPDEQRAKEMHDMMD